MPDEFRTMAACEALGTMLPVFERYGSLVTLVMKELLRSIYEVLPATDETINVWTNTAFPWCRKEMHYAYNVKSKRVLPRGATENLRNRCRSPTDVAHLLSPPPFFNSSDLRVAGARMESYRTDSPPRPLSCGAHFRFHRKKRRGRSNPSPSGNNYRWSFV